MENRFINRLLFFCLTLGFFSLFVFHLPSKIEPFSIPNLQPIATFKPEPTLQGFLDDLPSQQTIDRENLLPPPLPEAPAPIVYRSLNLDKETERHPLQTFTPVATASQKYLSPHFQITPLLETPVEFWRNVFVHLKESQSILHDPNHLEIIYGELDFTHLYEDERADRKEVIKIRLAIEEKRKKEIVDMLTRFHEGELPVSDFERSLFNAYDHVTEPEKFKVAALKVRSQWGFKEKLKEAMIRFGRYQKELEVIFQVSAVPTELSRLTFVESMFNMKATSKVGAAGPYQFMRETADRYILIDEVIDERRDPLISGWAAAQLLLSNYEHLKTWPLAMNAYNSGPERLEQAVRKIRTRDIAKIIREFDGAGYGFASRNFYPEFLAIVEVTKNYRDYFGELLFDQPVPFDELVLSFPTSLFEISAITTTDIRVLKDLNPAYDALYFEPFGIIPPGYTVRVPEKQRPVFLSAIQLYQAQQREIHWHIVGERENLEMISLRYQVPKTDIAEANGLLGQELHRGQVLKIPGHESRVVLQSPR